ncbi:MAG: serine/threonine protein kinase [Deltaproteobacteria bacterium]|nr:serine/threonine protein kinase [Deltaproteobacteria bacterium]
MIEPGAVVGSTWLVERLLGKGGMGAVWLARHQRLPDKRAAIKVLVGTGLRDEAYLRFAREAEIATRIGHPNIVDVLDMASLPGGEPYIVLEYLQGEDLRARLRKYGSLTFAETCELTRQIGSALLAAHRQGVVHRDLKPENVFLVPTDSGGVIRDHVKVLDFGISKLRGSQTVQTQEAMLLGTPQYMAPEQAAGRNQDVDARTDQFALAVMVYEMVTGRPPWQADTPLGLLFQVVHAPTPAIGQHAPDLPGHAIAAIERALSKDAPGRFDDVAQFVEALTGAPLAALPSHKGDTRSHGAAFRKTGPVSASTRKEDHDTSPEVELPTFDGRDVPAAGTVMAAPRRPDPPAPPPIAERAIHAKADPAAPRKSLAWVPAVIAAVGLVGVAWWAAHRGKPGADTPSAMAAAGGLPGIGDAIVAIERDAWASAAEPTPTRTASPAAVPAPAAVVPTGPATAAAGFGGAAAPVPADPAPADDTAAAEAAMAAEDWATAERRAARAAAGRSDPRAFAILVRVHCQRGDRAGARTWFGQVPAGARQAARAWCAVRGVEL